MPWTPYGGSVTNRMRLLRELLEDTVEEVDGRAAVACRIAVDGEFGAQGAFRRDVEEVLDALGELPTCGTSPWARGRCARSPPGSARRAARSGTSPG